jgi:predicted DCC family thiol-disulfide oxidoreductase YuxK
MPPVNQAPSIIFYDSQCPICQRSKRLLESVDYTHQLNFIPAQDMGTVQRYPALKPEALLESMHVVNPEGEIHAGAAAYREIGRRISPRSLLGATLKAFSWITRLPGVLPIAEWVYTQVAKRRYKLFPSLVGSCADGVCQLPTAPKGNAHERL